MGFQPEKEADFLSLFEESAPTIRAFKGCENLELLKAKGEGVEYFTYSLWQSEEALKLYRDSAFFKTTWEKTKKLFSQKPEAWSLLQVSNIKKTWSNKDQAFRS